MAVVTGAGSGIGRALALRFADEGMDVAVTDIDGAALASTAEAVASRGVRTVTHVADVGEQSEVEAFADLVYAELGAVHLLCNNAGSTWAGRPGPVRRPTSPGPCASTGLHRGPFRPSRSPGLRRSPRHARLRMARLTCPKPQSPKASTLPARSRSSRSCPASTSGSTASPTAASAAPGAWAAPCANRSPSAWSP
ncbi:SDR family NAD(P)-dependent oxidoreductase [Actinocorallia herbida]|uniref:SDR family NAD(P)-dependent oxidoreductase n=1 Tax=Actinocorallia herbida TaxID=58109 RepID=UPI003CCC82C3